MKRHDLIKHLEQVGCYLIHHGGKHDIYHNPSSGRSEPVPRHREINERLARKIIKSLTEDIYERSPSDQTSITANYSFNHLKLFPHHVL